MSPTLTASDARALTDCLDAGGVAIVPTDTVYGLACDPGDALAVRRIYELKGRPPERPAAVMYCTLEGALAVLPELLEAERGALRALLPGPVTALLVNRGRRHLLASGPDPGTLGLRVPLLKGPLAALRGVQRPLLQSSANHSGGPDPRALSDVPEEVRGGVDLVLDGGTLSGIASTVIDLRHFALDGGWEVLRAGGLAGDEVAGALASVAGSC